MSRRPVLGWALGLVVLVLALGIAYAATTTDIVYASHSVRVGPMANPLITLDGWTGNANVSGVLNPVGMMLDTVTNTDGSETATIGKSMEVYIATKSDGATTIAVPAPSASTIGCVWIAVQTADQNLKITSAGGDDTDCFITPNSADSDYITFQTATELIGVQCMVIGVSATKHLFVNQCGLTATVTDTD